MFKTILLIGGVLSQPLIANPECFPEVLLLEALAIKESNCNPKAYNESEDAVGLYQIRPIYLKDVNRILNKEKYKLDDRWNAEKSEAMVITYITHYTVAYNHAPRAMAAVHCGGPDGLEQYCEGHKAIGKYVDDVMGIFARLKNENK